jgi:glycine betaine/choline ABC-type transport system substrate-binding protein
MSIATYRITRRHLLGGIGAAAALAGAAPRLLAADAVKVGWTTDTEQSILGSMAALILEKKIGIPVTRVPNLGGTGIAHQAIIDGSIDVYPDYTGDALANVLKMSPITSPGGAYDAVKQAYAEKYKIAWLAPTPFNNTYALALKEAKAGELNITKISDLATHAPQWTLGSSVEFAGRPLDGYLGMSKAYGFKFGAIKPMDVGLMYTAIDNGDVDVIVAYATDARIGKVKLRVLQDDKEFFPAYNAAITVRQSVLDQYPAIRDAIDKVMLTLDTNTQIRLNGRSDIDNVAPEKVAEEYLTQKGFL